MEVLSLDELLNVVRDSSGRVVSEIGSRLLSVGRELPSGDVDG